MMEPIALMLRMVIGSFDPVKAIRKQNSKAGKRNWHWKPPRGGRKSLSDARYSLVHLSYPKNIFPVTVSSWTLAFPFLSEGKPQGQKPKKVSASKRNAWRLANCKQGKRIQVSYHRQPQHQLQAGTGHTSALSTTSVIIALLAVLESEGNGLTILATIRGYNHPTIIPDKGNRQKQGRPQTAGRHRKIPRREKRLRSRHQMID